jgi:hypothetical protein
MAFEFNRNIQDASYSNSTALHTTAANSASFDLEQVTGGDIEAVVGEIVSPASAATTGKICTYTLQDSANNSAWAAIDPATTTTITAADSALAAKTVRFRFPPNTRRYVRVAQTGDTLGSVSGSFTFKLLF